MVTEFSPIQSLLGGALIGVASALYLWGLGRVMGVSGVLSALLPPWTVSAAFKQRLAFVAGVLVVPAVGLLSGWLVAIEPLTFDSGLLIIAGLLTGFGTVLGSGCTSGHGVCGMARLSYRSFLATLVFMASAIGTTFVARHLLEWI